jgi:hypothetical protein
MMRTIALVAVTLLASGCMDHGHHRPMPGPRVCREGPVQNLVGREMSPRMQSRLRERSGARELRVVRSGDPVTMDFRADRLTVEVGRRGTIRSLRCG